MKSLPVNRIKAIDAAFTVAIVLVIVLDLGERPWVPLSQGALLSLLIGLVFTTFGLRAITVPRLEGIRQRRLIDSEDAGTPEQFGARLLGSVLALMGVGWISLGLWGTPLHPIAGFVYVFVALDWIRDPDTIGPRFATLIDFGELGPGERFVIRTTAVLLFALGIGLLWTGL